MVDYVDSILDIPRLGCICRKFEIGIGPPFQIYEASHLFFQFSYCTSKWIIDFTTSASSRHKGPFSVAPVMDYQKMLEASYFTHRYSYSFVSLSRHTGIFQVKYFAIYDA